MLGLFVSASVAASMTAIYAFRFSASRGNPWRLVRYFLLFFAAEWLAEHFLLEEGTMGVEVGVVSLVVTALFVIAVLIRDRLDPA